MAVLRFYNATDWPTPALDFHDGKADFTLKWEQVRNALQIHSRALRGSECLGFWVVFVWGMAAEAWRLHHDLPRAVPREGGALRALLPAAAVPAADDLLWDARNGLPHAESRATALQHTDRESGIYGPTHLHAYLPRQAPYRPYPPLSPTIARMRTYMYA